VWHYRTAVTAVAVQRNFARVEAQCLLFVAREDVRVL